VTHGGGQVGGAMVVDNAGGLVVINSDFFDNNSTCHTTLADHITVGRQADAIMMDAQHSAAVLWTDSRFGGEY
jgi:hypothetical protein